MAIEGRDYPYGAYHDKPLRPVGELNWRAHFEGLYAPGSGPLHLQQGYRPGDEQGTPYTGYGSPESNRAAQAYRDYRQAMYDRYGSFTRPSYADPY